MSNTVKLNTCPKCGVPIPPEAAQGLCPKCGVLKWVFAGLLAVALPTVILSTIVPRQVMVPRGRPEPVTETAAAASTAPGDFKTAIQFTFTTVEVREEEGARWLAMDFVQQARGNCERTIRYDARVPGFPAVTRTTAFLSDAKAGFARVVHQRISWKLPESLAQSTALELRDLIAREWIGKSAAVEPGDERILFKALIPNGGSLAASIGVRMRMPSGPDAHRELADRLDYLLKREKELSAQFTSEHSLVKEVRRQIAEARAEMERFGKTP